MCDTVSSKKLLIVRSKTVIHYGYSVVNQECYIFSGLCRSIDDRRLWKNVATDEKLRLNTVQIIIHRIN